MPDADRPGTPKAWRVLEVEVGPAHLDLALLALTEAGASAVEELPEGLRTMFPETAEGEAALGAARAGLEALLGPEVSLIERRIPHEVWGESWRRGLGPRQVSRRVLVRPSWFDPQPLPPGSRELVLDPGVAFGTAEHATTRGSMRLLDGVIEAGDRVADLGSGSGILAIAAALLGAKSVIAVDFDPFATGAALENVDRNGVSGIVDVREQLLDGPAVRALAPLDGLLANIRTGVLIELLPAMNGALRPGGWAVLSGIPDDEVPELLPVAESVGFMLEEQDREDGWTSLLLVREER